MKLLPSSFSSSYSAFLRGRGRRRGAFSEEPHMARSGTTEDEDRQTIPLLGGARAVRPWGGWWNRNEPTPALRDRCRFGEGFSNLHPLRWRGFQESVHAAGRHRQGQKRQYSPLIKGA